jgi:hypothetical protein
MSEEKAIYVLEMNNPFLGGKEEQDLSEAMDMAIKALEGKHYERAILIPNGATNGDMIKAMFPEGTNIFDINWWNAPYEGGKEE